MAKKYSQKEIDEIIDVAKIMTQDLKNNRQFDEYFCFMKDYIIPILKQLKNDKTKICKDCNGTGTIKE